MSIGELARYLMVSRQNLSGLIGRMERDGHVAVAPDDRDRRSRVVTMTERGRHVWQVLALPKIHAAAKAHRQVDLELANRLPGMGCDPGLGSEIKRAWRCRRALCRWCCGQEQ